MAIFRISDETLSNAERLASRLDDALGSLSVRERFDVLAVLLDVRESAPDDDGLTLSLVLASDTFADERADALARIAAERASLARRADAIGALIGYGDGRPETRDYERSPLL